MGGVGFSYNEGARIGGGEEGGLRGVHGGRGGGAGGELCESRCEML